jgi:hypothetical protein
MAMSLWDHERRLDDLETLLRRLIADASRRPGGVDLNEMARALRANGAAGAADLLTSSRHRPYVR